jgi:hypothetical protein
MSAQSPTSGLQKLQRVGAPDCRRIERALKRPGPPEAARRITQSTSLLRLKEGYAQSMWTICVAPYDVPEPPE